MRINILQVATRWTFSKLNDLAVTYQPTHPRAVSLQIRGATLMSFQGKHQSYFSHITHKIGTHKSKRQPRTNKEKQERIQKPAREMNKSNQKIETKEPSDNKRNKEIQRD